MSRPCSSLPKKRGAKGKPWVLQEQQKVMDKRWIAVCWPAHSVSHAHDARRQLSAQQGNLCQWFSLWLCFPCSCAHAPCCVSLSSSAMLSSKIRILRKGSQSQNPFVPQDVAWIGDRIAPVDKYC